MIQSSWNTLDVWKWFYCKALNWLLNLKVNLAVNDLLQQADVGDDGGEDDAPYLHGGG